MSPTASEVTYDSDQRGPAILSVWRNLYDYRGLIRLLVVRDLTVRYKRSMLGVWWTLLNPLLLATVMWMVFSAIFRFHIEEAPYIVYLLSGVLLITYFQQGITAAGGSIVGSSGILTKVYVPAEAFAFAAVAAAGVHFLISLVPLVVVQLVTGTGIPWTAVFVPVPAMAMMMLLTGAGLLVATAAIRFYDAMDLSGVFVMLLSYLTPTFYPETIIPEQYRHLLQLNPLYHYLRIFRSMMYEGGFAEPVNWLVMVVTSLVVLWFGTWVFSNRWRALAVML